jgi:hypothetical protein
MATKINFHEERNCAFFLSTISVIKNWFFCISPIILKIV